MGWWYKVESTHLSRVRYFKKTKLLVVQFKDKKTQLPGGIWIYKSVPWSVYMKLLRAKPPKKSHGEFFGAFIRMTFEYQEIELSEAKRLGLI